METVLAIYALWPLFLATMALRWKWNTLPIAAKILSVPCVLIAILWDALFNYTIACALFLRLPARGEWTFSQRLGNYKKRADWRAPLAHWICANLLDPFEADGAHCRE